KGKAHGNTESPRRLDITSADSGTGEAKAGPHAHEHSSCDRRGFTAGSVSKHAERWCSRSRPADSGRVRGESRGEPVVAARPLQAGDLLRTTRPTRAHSQRRRVENTTDWHPDLRGQGTSEVGGQGTGVDLRTGFPGLLVRLPAWPVRAPSAGQDLPIHDAHARRVRDRAGYRAILRPARSQTTPDHARPAGA